MLWIALVIALGLLVGLLIVTYGYRRSMLVVLAVLGAIIVALVWYLRFGEPQGAGLIDAEELKLSNLEMSLQYRTSYRMTARLVNTSEDYALTSVTITITASDCATGAEDCIVIGEAQRDITVEVPPGQARDIVQQYVFPRLSPRGELRWSHALSNIKAERP